MYQKSTILRRSKTDGLESHTELFQPAHHRMIPSLQERGKGKRVRPSKVREIIKIP